MQPNSFIIAGHEISAPPLEPALYLVATPIGNLGDITIRALETLAACDVLACEDTRVTRRLLDRYGIQKKLFAYHEHNAAQAGPKLLEALGAGQSVSLVSDAGTPLVSDPGYRLGVQAREADHPVVPVPGASAVLAGLAASGLPTDDFRFVGFVPNKDGARRKFFENMSGVQSTLIMFDAPTRLPATLKAVVDVFGADREICVGRELTKRFETILSGNASKISEYFEDETIKGEIVLLIAPSDADVQATNQQELDTILRDLLGEMSVSKAAKEAASLTGLPKTELYARLLALKEGHE